MLGKAPDPACLHLSASTCFYPYARIQCMIRDTVDNSSGTLST